MHGSDIKRRGFSRRRLLFIIVALVVLAAVGAIIREYRHYLWPHRFRVVEKGEIYRGARQTPIMLRWILKSHHIRTIVNLDDKVLKKSKAGKPDLYLAEKTIAREYGVKYYGFIWGGGGIGPFEEYDRVADILASTATHPVFVHCAAGQKRTNAALAAYWIRRCGYTFDQAVERLKRQYGLIPEQKPDFLRHLRLYYEYTQRNPLPAAKTSGAEKSPPHDSKSRPKLN